MKFIVFFAISIVACSCYFGGTFMECQTILKVRDICKSFFGFNALENISFDVNKGEVVGLLGANGAGKSTMLKIIGEGFVSDKGEIHYNGRHVTFKTPHEAHQNGIITVYQELNLFENMSVTENLFIGREIRTAAGIIDWKAQDCKAREILDSLDLDISQCAVVSSLSVAQKHLVEIARAISECPKLLLLDEPTASLSEDQIKWLFEKIKELSSKGTTIVYVSHRLDEVTEICDRCIILRDGKLVKILNENFDKNTIVKYMIGHEVKLKRKEISHKNNNVVLECRNISTKNKVNDVSLKLHEGEILGIGGLVGSGRTELLKAIYGIDRTLSGEIILNGNKVEIKNPRDAIESGIVFLSEDRKLEQLFMQESVSFNITSETMEKRVKRGFIDFEAEKVAVEKVADQVKIDKTRLDHMVRTLSGGNQQKTVIAKKLLAEASVIIMDEPTRGVDVGARSEIYKIIDELSQSGKAILLVSSDWEEIVVMCDRVLVMSEGKITGELIGEEITEENMMHLSTIANIIKNETSELCQSRSKSRLTALFRNRSNTSILFIILVMLMALGIIISPSFRTFKNMHNLIGQSVVTILLTVGQLIVIIAGGIDLSIGSLFAVSNVAGLSIMLKDPNNIVLGIIIMLLIGIIIGLINGLLAAKAHVDSFVATLGVSIFLQGAALIITKRPIAPTPRFIRNLANGSVFFIPNSLIVLTVFLFIFAILLKYTRLGRYFYAVGESSITSYWAGLPVVKSKVFSFVICSVMSVAAGIYMIGRTGAADPAYGPGLELDAIACSLIGGATLAGGKGSLAGGVLAVLVMTVIVNILNHLGVEMYYQNVFRGVLMLFIIISYERKIAKDSIK